jgi:hypothetical protein
MATPAINPIGSDESLTNFVNSPDYTPVVPDMSMVDMSGQMSGMPGGDLPMGPPLSPDALGINAIATNPAVNPNPTGNWQGIASQIVGLAAQGMRTFSSGSPSPAIPPVRRPLNTQSLFAAPGSSSTKWMVVGGVVVVGIGVMIVLGVF